MTGSWDIHSDYLLEIWQVVETSSGGGSSINTHSHQLIHILKQRKCLGLYLYWGWSEMSTVASHQLIHILKQRKCLGLYLYWGWSEMSAVASLLSYNMWLSGSLWRWQVVETSSVGAHQLIHILKQRKCLGLYLYWGNESRTTCDYLAACGDMTGSWDIKW